MLRKFNEYRSFSDNLKLAVLTAFSAGMVNVISVILFFAFTSNVTGYYAILAQELSKGNWYQAAVVLIWISAFLFGNFTSNIVVINRNEKTGQYLINAIPVVLEIICILFVGIYLEVFYNNTLQETEVLVGIMLFAMGLQNGLTASISNFSVKTTHLTGLTTDLGILLSMFTKKKYRADKKLVQRATLLIGILIAYLTGGILSGLFYYSVGNYTFFIVCVVLTIILFYDLYKSKIAIYFLRNQPFYRKEVFTNYATTENFQNQLSNKKGA